MVKTPVLANRLENETSPYLLQHKDNPVHWQPWDEQALEAARRLNRPILLSVGYSACHWCHVMAHESFEDEAVAEVMNELFVNIKVDREERPDIDDIYMSALNMMGEQGGWPLTMFLLPDGRPFWGGTYFPPAAKFGRPGFPDICREIARLCREESGKVASNAEKLTEALGSKNSALLKNAGLEQLPDGLPPDLAGEASENLARQVDPKYGGLQGAPKFPQPLVFELLWQDWLRQGREVSREGVLTTLDGLCSGGIFDHVGGGFCRYSVDAEWLVPHFEKMLYDNALLLDLMGRVWKTTRNPMLAHRIEKTVSWLASDMLAPDGAFAASLDADSEGEEGKYYVWRVDELASLLGENFSAFARDYNVTEKGNFHEPGGPDPAAGHQGANILNRLPPGRQWESFETEKRHFPALDILAKAQRLRVPPGRDDKILADWNGLVIAALARLAPAFGRGDWLELAQKSFDKILEIMSFRDPSGSGCLMLSHAARGGNRLNVSMAEDYANMADAALALFSATGNRRCLSAAEDLVRTLRRYYADGVGAFYMTSSETDSLITRPHSAFDGATPCANGTLLGVFHRLAVLTGTAGHREGLDALIRAQAASAIKNYPQMPRYLTETENVRHQASCVLVGNPEDGDYAALLKAAHAHPCPGLIIHPAGPEENLPENLGSPVDKMSFAFDRPTAYVCNHHACMKPAVSVQELNERLNGFLHAGALEN